VKVPLLDLNAQNHALAPELKAAFERVFGHGRFILGEEVAAFEDACAQELGVKHAIGVSSGTDALLLALMTLGVGPGDEVVCPSFSFFATAGSIARVGARPVFADICPRCFNLDPESAAERITPQTKAIMPVHLFGQAAAMEPLLALARAHHLRVIEDAAQAFGATRNGQTAGGFGDFGCFSFFPTKNLGGLGDGGLLTTNDDALAEQARVLRVHGAAPKYHHAAIGGNFRLDALQAALLAVKLPHHRHYREARAANARRYLAALGEFEQGANPECAACGAESSGDRPSGPLILPRELPPNRHIWNQFTLRLPAAPGCDPAPREALRLSLAERGVAAEIYYPAPLNRQPCFAASQPHPCPVAERIAGEVLSIPVYPELTTEQIDRVAAAIGDFLSPGLG